MPRKLSQASLTVALTQQNHEKLRNGVTIIRTVIVWYNYLLDKQETRHAGFKPASPAVAPQLNMHNEHFSMGLRKYKIFKF